MERTSASLGVLPNQVGFNMRRAYFKATLFFGETFADLEITPMQFAILEVIGCNEGLAQKNVAELVGTAPSVIVKPVRELEMRKLVGRKRSPDDRRHHVLSLTTAGKALQQEAQTRIQEVENNLLAPLNADERAKLLELLHKLLL